MENVFEVEQDGMTAVLVQDLEDRGYTSFYKEDSRAVGQGETQQEALESLREGYEVLNKWENEEKYSQEYLKELSKKFEHLPKDVLDDLTSEEEL